MRSPLLHLLPAPALQEGFLPAAAGVAVFPAVGAVALAAEAAASGKINKIRWNLCSYLSVLVVQTLKGERIDYG